MRADLAEVYGIDLAEYFHKRRWRALVELIYELPSTSRCVDAQVNDPYLARVIAQADSGEDAGPSVRDETVTNDYLRSIEYRLGELIRVVAGGKGRKIKPRPRPVTQVEQAKKELRQQRADELISKITPWAVNG